MDRLPVEAEGKRWFRLKAGFAVSRAVQATILIFVFFCFTVPFCIQSLGKADALQPSWSSAEIWIQSAECARTTGAILAICKDGKLVPIADASTIRGRHSHSISIRSSHKGRPRRMTFQG
jgi:hypothetical protein